MIILMNNNEIALMSGFLVLRTVLSTLLKTFCPYSNPTRSYSCYLVLVYRQGADTLPPEARSHQHYVSRAFIPSRAKSPPRGPEIHAAHKQTLSVSMALTYHGCQGGWKASRENYLKSLFREVIIKTKLRKQKSDGKIWEAKLQANPPQPTPSADNQGLLPPQYREMATKPYLPQ